MNWFRLYKTPVWCLCASRRRFLACVLVFSLFLLGFGLYLQHGLGLEPCPMCIVQRYAWILLAAGAAWGASSGRPWVQILGLLDVVLFAAGGAFVAARQSWLQWFPPTVMQCGRDFYGMVETFPLQRAIPMIFRGSGDCTQVDWTFLGGSIANWSLICFVLVGVLALHQLFKPDRGADRA